MAARQVDPGFATAEALVEHYNALAFDRSAIDADGVTVIAVGPPGVIARSRSSHTGRYLKPTLAKRTARAVAGVAAVS